MNQPESVRRLGDFEIVRELGRGGMGVVYEARQLSLNRQVALKVLSGGLGLTSKAVQRFRREAEAAAKLHHTNIVPVYATGEQDGTHFYAMELIEGPSLDKVLRQIRASQAGTAPVAEPARGLVQTTDFVAGTSTAEEAGLSASSLSSGGAYFDTVARMVAEVADALEYAHAHSVIHRDVKPANLLLSPDGRLSVNDFGLARVLEQPGVTMTGEFVGTPAYMSPEQITAGRTPLDHRTDVYSLGATLYELLTLRPPFSAERRDQVLNQILHKEPVPPRKLNRKAPVDLETVCLKCLEKDPDRRYPTAKALADDLRRYLSRFALAAKRAGPIARLAKFVRRHQLATAAGAVILLLAAAAGVALGLYRQAQRRAEAVEQVAAVEGQKNWAHGQIPVIEAYVKARQHQEAFDLLQKVEAILPEDPRVAVLRTECSWELTILTDPPGVNVFRKPADHPDGAWDHLGQTPIDKVRLARGFYRWKLEKPGYETVEGLGRDRWHQLTRPNADVAEAVSVGRGVGQRGTFEVQMAPQGSGPEGMVRVPGHRLAGLPLSLPAGDITLGAFYLDRFEVTNRQFKQFVDQGGYRRKEFWEHPFEKEGKALSWDEALAEFRDATGRPGPATWELGGYPDGQDEYPVAGVSWYEAAAFAAFAGKSLPTVYHWLATSGHWFASEIVPWSNFGRAGPAKVGQYPGLGLYGTYDMAGNVKEWCFNSAGDGRRYILGGAWDEQPYRFADLDSRSPFHRARNCGFRCAKYLPGQESSPQVVREVKPQRRDYLNEKLLTDPEFEFIRRAYAYDRRALNAREVRDEETAQWVRERIEYVAAYGKEPAVAYLFLPRHVRPPYQPVIYWPGSYALAAKAISPLDNEGVAFLVRSGRALVWPVYQGTYERRIGQARGAAEAWERLKQQVNDLRRAIDYLETRDDLDSRTIGYYGVSWGAGNVGIATLAVEDRIKAAVLADGGLPSNRFSTPERDSVHYLPRIKTPVLMLNGEYDHIFPRAESQDPMFRFLGTPAEHKKHLLFKESHGAIQPERIQEAVNWFDTYLGPVKPSGN
jgi:formylglycine-generating enzyme required for sulfatase activity/dienelactone hydrolase